MAKKLQILGDYTEQANKAYALAKQADKKVDTLREAVSKFHSNITEEASGEVISLSDASDDSIHGLTLYGKTTQNGTPTPESPVPLESVGDSGSVGVTVAAKNLQGDNLGLIQRTYKGVTYTPVFNSDGTLDYILVNGTATANSSYYCTTVQKYHLTMPKGEIVTVSGGTANVFVYLQDKTYKQTLCSPRRGDLTPTKVLSNVIYGSGLEVLSGTTVNNEKIRPQLELGSTATAYEPYKPAQTLTAQTPNGLPGIPVTDATIATYTDENGQQWVCDEVDFARGVYVKRVGQQVLTGGEYFVCYTQSNGIDTRVQMHLYGIDEAKKYDSNIVTYSTHFKGSIDGWVAMPANSVQYYSTIAAYVFSGIITEDEVRVFFTEQYNSGTPVKTQYLLETPIENALSAEELAQYAALHSNKPNTTVYNDSGAGMKLEYNADTKTYIDNKFAELAAAIVNNA